VDSQTTESCALTVNVTARFGTCNVLFFGKYVAKFALSLRTTALTSYEVVTHIITTTSNELSQLIVLLLNLFLLNGFKIPFKTY